MLNVNVTQSQGKVQFDSSTKVLVWDLGRMEPGKLPNIRGTIALQSGAPLPDSNPTILIKFQINQLAISGLKVNRLDMYGEVSEESEKIHYPSFDRMGFISHTYDRRYPFQRYKPFKGVKYVTKVANFQVRT